MLTSSNNKVRVGVAFKLESDPHYRDVELFTYHFVPRMGDLVTKGNKLFVVDRVIVTEYADDSTNLACIIYVSQAT